MPQVRPSAISKQGDGRAHDNAGYGAMRFFSRILQAQSPPGIELPGLDFVSLARGFGCEARRVTDPGDLDGELIRSFSSEGPTLIDVIVDDAVAVLFEEGRKPSEA